MQASQWTTEIIVICVIAAIASLVVGYVVAALRQGRQLSRLTAELEQAQQAQASAVAASATLGGQLKAVEARSQELQVSESKLKAQLQAAYDNVTRLDQEQQEAKDRHAALETKLEQSVKLHNQAVTQHETALTEVRSLKANVEDYQKRLELAQTDLQKEREAVSQLKSELGQEGKSAKGFEEANNEARAQLIDLKGQLKAADEKLQALQGEFAEIKRQETKLKAEMDERQASQCLHPLCECRRRG